MAMSTNARFGMGIMAGIVASIVMTITVIAVTALGFLSIQWFPWVGSVLGSNGIGASLAEVGVAWFFALGIIAGLIFAFIFRAHNVYRGLGFGAIAWFLVVLYLVFETAPQLSGPLGSLTITTSIELLVPLAVCFGLWGATMGYVGKRYID
jgi:hypothetical protein